MLRNTALMALGATSLVLAGCTEMDGTMNRPATGAIIGGLTGAAVGNAVGDRDAAIIGGAVGAVIGTTIGAQLDQQEAELNSQLAGSGATVINTGSAIQVTLPENVTFATGSSVVSAGFQGSLARVAQNLIQRPNSTIRVVGHTDNVGTAEYNQALSAQRALAVARILIANGVAASRITYAGQGMNQPIASNTTEAGRAMNRRVEIFITPTG